MKNELVFVSHYSNYLIEVMEKIKESKTKVCYVTLNKTYSSIAIQLKRSKLNEKDFYFIDAITTLVKDIKNCKECTFLAPDETGKIYSAIKKAIKKSYTTVVFDSLSNVLAQEDSQEKLIKFIKKIIKLVKEKNGRLIVICNADDRERVSSSEVLEFFNEFSTVDV